MEYFVGGGDSHQHGWRTFRIPLRGGSPLFSLMPELPEVETVVRQLASVLPGHSFESVSVIRPDLLREPSESFSHGLEGSAVRRVFRRGKNIVMNLSDPSFLVVNLGMTGQLFFSPPSEEETGTDGVVPTPTHLGVVFTLAPPATLLYADTRRFGCLRRFSERDWEVESARIGPEPLEDSFTPEDFHHRLGRSASPIRSWLLDQTRIAGIGNIYACEALFRAGIHPHRPSSSLAPEEAKTLLEAIRDVLSDAIVARGTTLRDYRTASGEQGGFRPFLQAYGRKDEPCVRCNTPIVRVVFANRSAFFCPRCQPSV